MAASNKDRIDKCREKKQALGLVPLRIPEVWMTPGQHDYLKIEVNKLITSHLSKPA